MIYPSSFFIVKMHEKRRLQIVVKMHKKQKKMKKMTFYCRGVPTCKCTAGVFVAIYSIFAITVPECMHFYMVFYSLVPECMHFYMVFYSLGPECMHFRLGVRLVRPAHQHTHQPIQPTLAHQNTPRHSIRFAFAICYLLHGELHSISKRVSIE